MNNTDHPATVPVWIVSGFLGSGKTTVVNQLLRKFSPTPVGVVVNDFGKLGVDRHLLRTAESDTVIELNGGQIFCSCISGSFVDALTAVSETAATAILVEASGMAKPSAMSPILEQAITLTQNRLVYGGMVTVVDVTQFLKLRSVVNAVDEQIVHADLLVINKIDTASPEATEKVRHVLGELNPRAGIVAVSHGAVDTQMLPRTAGLPQRRVGPGGESYSGWEEQKPKAVTWTPPANITKEQLEAEMENRAKEALRIKGFAETVEGPVLVSVVGPVVEISDVENIPGEPGLTAFYPVSATAAEETDMSSHFGILRTEKEERV